MSTQNVVGAEIEKTFYYYDDGEAHLSIRVQVCRYAVSAEYVLLDWGDGQSDTIPLASALNAGNGYFFNHYYADHTYEADTARYVELTLRAGTVMEGFANVDYTLGGEVVLRDTLFVYTPESSPLLGFISYNGPLLEYTDPVWYDGAEWWESLLMQQPFPQVDIFEYSLGEFPVAGYVAPAPEDELYVEGTRLYWNYPVEPGQYAVAGKLHALRQVNNPIYEEPFVLVSTITKAFTVFVDSAYIVSITPGSGIDAVVSLYPNPAAERVTLECAGLSGRLEVEVRNAQGRIMLRRELTGTEGVGRQTLNLSTWPPGVYWVELQSERGRITKKLVVTGSR